MLFKVTYRKIGLWIFLSVFVVPMLLGGCVLIGGFFHRDRLAVGYRTVTEALPGLFGGLLLLFLAFVLIMGHAYISKDVLEVYPDRFILKQRGQADWTVYVKDATLKYTYDDETGGNRDAIHQYCLKFHTRTIQVFSNEFKNIDRLCTFCMENHVPEIAPATWEKCKKHLRWSLFS